MLKKNSRIIKEIIPLLIIAFILGAMSLGDVYENREAYGDSLIRFHVIANSDSKEDQELKLKVRDKVIEEMDSKFQESSSIDDSRNIIKDNLEEIKDIAQGAVKNLGKKYDVNVYFGDYDFPTKSYGNFTLPAGEYEAVKIVIGEGKGENWWCVMFPPLCFIDINHGITSNKTQEELKKVLTDEEYGMIVSARSEDEIPIKLKFKVVEMFEKGRIRFAKLFVSQK